MIGNLAAGNNEDYQLAESLSIIDYTDESSDYRCTKFPARYIYERTLPFIVNTLSDIHYHRGSPYSAPGVPTTDPTLGDLHQCMWQSAFIELQMDALLRRERLARDSGALAKLGQAIWAFCIGIWNVWFSFLLGRTESHSSPGKDTLISALSTIGCRVAEKSVSRSLGKWLSVRFSAPLIS